jgi:hypothetical protein|nr:MAG TPA: hypothetical protein [Caudoviricetes sp.]
MRAVLEFAKMIVALSLLVAFKLIFGLASFFMNKKIDLGE